MQFDRQTRLAFIVACAALLICGIGFKAWVRQLNYYLKKEPVELRRSLSQIDRHLPGWTAVGQDEQLDEAMVEELGTDKYLERMYAVNSGTSKAWLYVHVAYYTGMIDTVPHVPDRCLVAAGFNAKTLPANVPLTIDRTAWKEDPGQVNGATGQPYPMYEFAHRITGQRQMVRMPLDVFELRTTEFEHPDQPAARVLGGYLFIANGRTTPSPDSIRMLAFNLTNKYAYYCKVQFMMFGEEDLEIEEYLKHVSGLMSELLPELMLCLPDWAEVEARERVESAVGAEQRDE